MTTNFQVWMADALSENNSTPDVPLLESQDYWPVFIYAGRKGKVYSYLTQKESEAEFLSIGWTKSNIYSILNVQVGSLNYQLADPTGTDRILGEVWVLPSDLVMDLDSYERNLYHQKRVLVPITVGKGKTIDAWMYTAHPDLLRNGPVKVSRYGRYTYYGPERYLEIV
jgi:gamma-glutamylcyclotransferase (GGCT)/AIG2-like uncharacterized protein YtfP